MGNPSPLYPATNDALHYSEQHLLNLHKNHFHALSQLTDQLLNNHRYASTSCNSLDVDTNIQNSPPNNNSTSSNSSPPNNNSTSSNSSPPKSSNIPKELFLNFNNDSNQVSNLEFDLLSNNEDENINSMNFQQISSKVKPLPFDHPHNQELENYIENEIAPKTPITPNFLLPELVLKNNNNSNNQNNHNSLNSPVVLNSPILPLNANQIPFSKPFGGNTLNQFQLNQQQHHNNHLQNSQFLNIKHQNNGILPFNEKPTVFKRFNQQTNKRKSNFSHPNLSIKIPKTSINNALLNSPRLNSPFHPAVFSPNTPLTTCAVYSPSIVGTPLTCSPLEPNSFRSPVLNSLGFFQQIQSPLTPTPQISNSQRHQQQESIKKNNNVNSKTDSSPKQIFIPQYHINNSNQLSYQCIIQSEAQFNQAEIDSNSQRINLIKNQNENFKLPQSAAVLFPTPPASVDEAKTENLPPKQKNFVTHLISENLSENLPDSQEERIALLLQPVFQAVTDPSTGIEVQRRSFDCACGKQFEKLCGMKSHLKVHQHHKETLSFNETLNKLEWINIETGQKIEILNKVDNNRSHICKDCGK
ncbi:hypothetical protein HK099_002291, partial [Clydaea vesicula]